MIAFSSRLSFRALVEDLQHYEGQRCRVYQAIRDWPGREGPSREDVARRTGIRLTSVCGRVAELLRQGVLGRGPMKLQEVVPGKPHRVETLIAVAYRPAQPAPQMQLNLFDKAA